MKIYNYDKETKEFLGQSEAKLSPLEKDVYLVPANATTTKPIETKEGFAICWNTEKQKWEHIEDNRGKVVYNTKTKEKVTIDTIEFDFTDFTEIEPKEFEYFENGKWKTDISLAKKQKLQEINGKYNEEVSIFTKDVPEQEIKSWTKQEEEARKYTLDNTTATPLIGKLAETRGVPLDVLVQKIIQKADAYAVAVGTLTGKRQRIEDALKVETTIKQIEAIAW